MIFKPLEIEGAFEIIPRKLEDKRGIFARVYCEDSFNTKSLNTDWVQMNTSINTCKGQIRGLHFQRPPAAEVKLIRCVEGRVFDVIIDLRKDSKTFGQAISINLDSNTLNMVYIPKGCAHGFQNLSDRAVLHYAHSEKYAPEHEGGVLYNDKQLNIAWPLPLKNISDRDSSFPDLNKIEPIKL